MITKAKWTARQFEKEIHRLDPNVAFDSEAWNAALVILASRDASQKSRAEIADAIGVSPATLDSWMARTRLERNLPLALLPDWCRATNSGALLAWAARDAGLWLGTATDRKLAELGKAYMQREEAGARLRSLLEECA